MSGLEAFTKDGETPAVGDVDRDRAIDPEEVVESRCGWMRLVTDGAVLRFESAAGDRLETYPGQGGYVVTVNDNAIAESLDDKHSAKKVVDAYLRDHPSTCQHDHEGCPGIRGFRAGVLPCWDCFRVSDEKDQALFFDAEKKRPGVSR